MDIFLRFLCAFPAAVDAGDVRDIGPVILFLPDHNDGIFSSHLYAVLVSQNPALRHPTSTDWRKAPSSTNPERLSKSGFMDKVTAAYGK